MAAMPTPAAREPLLPMVDGNPVLERAGRVTFSVASQSVALGFAFLAGVCLGPQLTGKGSHTPQTEVLAAATPGVIPSPEQLFGGPLGLGGLLGPVGACMRKLYDIFLPFAPAIKFVGVVMFVVIYLESFARKAANFSNTVNMMKNFGLPLPTLMAAGGITTELVGSLFLLSGIPVLKEIGSELLIIFLLAATYFGHFKPWRAATDAGVKKNHYLGMLKNLSMLGGCFMIIGYEVPLIGPE